MGGNSGNGGAGHRTSREESRILSGKMNEAESGITSRIMNIDRCPHLIRGNKHTINNQIALAFGKEIATVNTATLN